MRITEIRLTRAEKDCRTKNYKLHFLSLTTLMMLDFVVTWLGIHEYGLITEGNPIMRWLFELPFYMSLMARMGLVSVLVGMCIWIYNNGYDRFNLFINFCILCNILVMYAHNYWLLHI